MSEVVQKKSALNQSEYQALPLVYSCSGCASVAQLANRLAVKLDREKMAEMSCVVGIGGDVPAIVKKARSGRKIVVLDGCVLHCAKNCLDRHQIPINLHLDLHEVGVKKHYHQDPDEAEFQQIWQEVMLPEMQRI